jgi:hypothetical protein
MTVDRGKTEAIVDRGKTEAIVDRAKTEAIVDRGKTEAIVDRAKTEATAAVGAGADEIGLVTTASVMKGLKSRDQVRTRFRRRLLRPSLNLSSCPCGMNLFVRQPHRCSPRRRPCAASPSCKARKPTSPSRSSGMHRRRVIRGPVL